MAVYQPRYYGQQKYPEGPMWMSAGADMISAITQGIEAYKDRKFQEERFEKTDALAQSQRETEEQRYVTGQFGETADKEEELRRYAIAQARESRLDTEAAEQSEYDKVWGEKKFGLEERRVSALEQQIAMRGDDSGDPLRTYEGVRSVLASFDEQFANLDRGDVTRDEVEAELESVMNASPHQESLIAIKAQMDGVEAKSELSAIMAQIQMMPGFGILEKEIISRLGKVRMLDPTLPETPGPIKKPAPFIPEFSATGLPTIGTALQGLTKGYGAFEDWESKRARERRALADSIGMGGY